MNRLKLCFFVSQNRLRFLGTCLILAFNLVGHSPVGAHGALVSSLASYPFEFAGAANQAPGTFLRLRRTIFQHASPLIAIVGLVTIPHGIHEVGMEPGLVALYLPGECAD